MQWPRLVLRLRVTFVNDADIYSGDLGLSMWLCRSVENRLVSRFSLVLETRDWPYLDPDAVLYHIKSGLPQPVQSPMYRVPQGSGPFF